MLFWTKGYLCYEETINNMKSNYYFYLILNKLIDISRPLWGIVERKFNQKYASQPLQHQPVFIIGAPRTGSTILYQTITNELDVLYFDNLICGLKSSLMVGFWFSSMFFKNNAHNSFKSYHGNTTKFGSRAPSECGQFWYRWLPRDRHYIGDDDITETMVIDIRNEITSIINHYDKPMVFKNLNAGQRLHLLHKCFPNAKFIFIKRDPLYTAQSIILSKRRVGVKDEEFWGIKPRNFQLLSGMNPYEQIVKQIYYIEKQIEKDRTLFPRQNFLTIDYSQLGNSFKTTLNKCNGFIKAGGRTDSKHPAEIVMSETLKLDDFEIEKFTEEIQKLDWINYSN